MTEVEIFALLETVKDPEVPVLSVVELGIVRSVLLRESGVDIVLTPTYSGCPAMHVIEADIRAALVAAGLTEVNISTVFAPPWTTDWIGETGREKLRAYGIAPPGVRESEPLVPMPRSRRSVSCPFCGSKDTELRSEFGSTACKSLMFCGGCCQPFEYFKSF